jgi:hypothetical protein
MGRPVTSSDGVEPAALVAGLLPLRIVEVPILSAGTILVGDFSELARAEREHRPVNWKAFAVAKDIGR